MATFLTSIHYLTKWKQLLIPKYYFQILLVYELKAKFITFKKVQNKRRHFYSKGDIFAVVKLYYLTKTYNI